MKRLKSPYITSSESFLSQIEPTDSADEAKINTSFQHLPVNGYAWVPQGASVFMRFLFLFAELNYLSTWFKAKN
jgi:hypothetical protein